MLTPFPVYVVFLGFFYNLCDLKKKKKKKKKKEIRINLIYV